MITAWTLSLASFVMAAIVLLFVLAERESAGLRRPGRAAAVGGALVAWAGSRWETRQAVVAAAVPAGRHEMPVLPAVPVAGQAAREDVIERADRLFREMGIIG